MKLSFDKEKLLTKDTLISLLLCLVALFAIRAMLPVSVDQNLAVVISKNRTPIRNLLQERDIEVSKTVMVDKLDLSRKNQFMHPELGDIGYGHNFFADVETQFIVRKAGTYSFIIASDDGFSLQINDRELCRYTGTRPIATQACNVQLPEGEHSFRLSYFQGGGHAGLTVQYSLHGDRKLYWFGKNSSLLRIKR